MLGRPLRCVRGCEGREESEVPPSLRSRDVGQRQLQITPASAPAAGRTPRGGHGIALRTSGFARPESPMSSERFPQSQRCRGALLAVPQGCALGAAAGPDQEKGALE